MSRSRRANVTPSELDEVLAGGSLPRDAIHYLLNVLRLREGAEVELGDGYGRIVTGRLERQGKTWRLSERRVDESGDDTVAITLAAGLLKPKRWRFLVEKCVELGLRRLIPIITERTVIRPEPRDVRGLQQRWRRIALEAAKQCRRSVATRVEPPILVTELFDSEATADADPPDGRHPNLLLADIDGSPWPGHEVTELAPTLLLVGPEGGLTDEERQAAKDTGFVPISLGGFTFRAETAAVALAVMARDRLGFAEQEQRAARCR